VYNIRDSDGSRSGPADAHKKLTNYLIKLARWVFRARLIRAVIKTSERTQIEKPPPTLNVRTVCYNILHALRHMLRYRTLALIRVVDLIWIMYFMLL